MDWLQTVPPHWLWIGVGLILAAMELVAPGVYIIWIAIPALITGTATGLMGLGFPAQIALFLVSSVVSVAAGRRYFINRPIISDDPLLNQKGARLIGEQAVVTTALVGGAGRVKLGDSEWSARGPDLDVGARVRVTGTSGTVLLVEAV